MLAEAEKEKQEAQELKKSLQEAEEKRKLEAERLKKEQEEEETGKERGKRKGN